MTSECSFLRPGWLYCDKAYIDADWKETLEKEYGVQIRTPRKKQRGDTLFTGDTMSAFVSSVRQPIESLLWAASMRSFLMFRAAITGKKGKAMKKSDRSTRAQ